MKYRLFIQYPDHCYTTILESYTLATSLFNWFIRNTNYRAMLEVVPE